MSTSDIEPSAEAQAVTIEQRRPRPLQSLVASARRLTSQTMQRGFKASTKAPWQDDAWEMFDLVGEERFLASTLAGRMAQAKFYVGELSEDASEDPVPVEDASITGILDAIGDSPTQFAQMVQRLGINLFVVGDGWLCGIPRNLFPASMRSPETLAVIKPSPEEEVYLPTPTEEPSEGIDIEELEWRMLSVSEVSINAANELTLELGDQQGEKVVCSPDDVCLIRVWRPHPRRFWEADSPTRSSLPVLREIVGLTMHISAQIDSRLAGAGLLIVPQSAARSLRQTAGLPEEDESDPFVDALMEAMIKPIADRANASAVVPLTITVPDETTNLFNYLTFAKPLDNEARTLRDEAIRRLALGQDAPPELLLGVGGMNHWGAWLVREDVITTHVEPPLALICDAITTQYLWPVLIDQGKPIEAAHNTVIWYDVSHMVMRPDRSNDAKDLHTRGVISDASLRDAVGFGDSDKPDTAQLDDISALGLTIARATPTLFNEPGLPKLVAQLKAVYAGDLPEANQAPPPMVPGQPPSEEEEPNDEEEEPSNEGNPPRDDGDSQNPTDRPDSLPQAASGQERIIFGPDGQTVIGFGAEGQAGLRGAPVLTNTGNAQTFALERPDDQPRMFDYWNSSEHRAMMHHPRCNVHCTETTHYLLEEDDPRAGD